MALRPKNITGRGRDALPLPGAPTVAFRVWTTGAPRLSSVKIVEAARRQFPQWDIDFYKGKGAYVHFIAPELFAEARRLKVDFLITMCDDFGLEDSTFLGRLPKHNVPVVDCLVPNWQGGDFYWNCYHLTKNGIFYSDNPYGKLGIQQVYSSALGLVCYRRDVLERTDRDLKMSPRTDKSGCVSFMGGNDSSFCQTLHQANVPLYMDMEIMVEHSAVINLKQTMDRLRVWTNHCLRTDTGPNIRKHGYLLPSRICVDLNAMGVTLPVCDSYQQTSAWHGIDEGISPPFSKPPGEVFSYVPQNG